MLLFILEPRSSPQGTEPVVEGQLQPDSDSLSSQPPSGPLPLQRDPTVFSLKEGDSSRGSEGNLQGRHFLASLFSSKCSTGLGRGKGGAVMILGWLLVVAINPKIHSLRSSKKTASKTRDAFDVNL